MSTIHFFNTETRQKEVLKPLQPGRVSMYTCGPTVYDFAHLGNFRTYVFEDVLRRTLKYFGLQVTQVMNLTDVDDKTIRRATERSEPLDLYTQRYKDAFFEDIKTLGIEAAEHYPAATDYVAPMIEMVQTLLDKGVAYRGGDGSIYFSIAKFPQYGRLSHLQERELKIGASERVASDEYEKDNVADFVLWKAYDPQRDGKVFWESPFGQGRPGWHLECSAMAMKLLGKTIDIHVGGVDNMFPHHENEIAQSEATSGVRFVNLWMHAEHLVIDGRKMSKSLGNFFALRELLQKGFTGMQIRYLLLGTHYRTQLNFTLQGLEAAKGALQRLHDFVDRLEEVSGDAQSPQLPELLERTKVQFDAAMADDLNVSAALAALFDMVREVNALCDTHQLGRGGADKVLALLHQVDEILGVLFVGRAEAAPADVEALAQQRLQARKSRDWAKADELRKAIADKGYLVEDAPEGYKLKKK